MSQILGPRGRPSVTEAMNDDGMVQRSEDDLASGSKRASWSGPDEIRVRQLVGSEPLEAERSCSVRMRVLRRSRYTVFTAAMAVTSARLIPVSMAVAPLLAVRREHVQFADS